MEIIVTAGPICPICGGNEVLLGGPVRPFKIHMGDIGGWSSNCTQCDIWFDELNRIEVDLRFIDCGVQMRSINWISKAPVSGDKGFDRLRKLCRNIGRK